MVDLEKFYDDRVRSLDESEHLKQVGHTLNGKPISSDDFNALVKDAVIALSLSQEDYLLDICCGNGVITKVLSNYCHSVCGIDLSNEMIEIAKLHNSSNNVTYFTSNVLDMKKHLTDQSDFTKIMMFGALQHFSPKELPALIKLIKSISAKRFTLLLGFIPNRDNKRQFYGTLEKKAIYFYRMMTHTDVMGTWWDKSFIKTVCDDMGLNCTFNNIPPDNYGHPFRFHAVIDNAKDSEQTPLTPT